MPIIVAVPRRGVVRGLVVRVAVIVAMAVLLVVSASIPVLMCGGSVSGVVMAVIVGMVMAIVFGVRGAILVVPGVRGIGRTTSKKEGGGEKGKKRAFHVTLVFGVGKVAWIQLINAIG